MSVPATESKDIDTLEYPFFGATFHLSQRSDGISNGTALWLSGQILAAYMASILSQKQKVGHPKDPHSVSNPTRIIELGSGIGLTALALASLGCDVVATDTRHVVQSVLSNNLHTNAQNELFQPQTRELDWSVDPTQWRWDDPHAIASSSHPHKERNNILVTFDPPFNYILSADTIYDPALSPLLLRAMHSLAALSDSALHASGKKTRSIAYLCVERRDPKALDATLKEANEIWGFKVERVPNRKVSKAMVKAGLIWEYAAWEGVEIWKLVLDKKENGE